MQEEVNDFIEALCRYVADELHRRPDVIYCRDAVKIADARNHIFYKVENCDTDEAADVYALRDLCHTDETMQTLPDRLRMQRIARNYWDW